MKVQGTIRKLSPSEKDAKRLSIQLDSEWFSLFTTDGKTDLKVGDMIEAEYIEKGNFKNLNLKTIKVLGRSVITEMVEDIRSNTSKKIEKQSCLKASSQYSKTPEENIINAKILYKSLMEDWN